MWCGMIDFLFVLLEVGLYRKQFLIFINICCNISFDCGVEIFDRDGVKYLIQEVSVVFGFEILRLLYWFEGFVIMNICGCIILSRFEVMIMVIIEEIFVIQVWYGNVCIVKFNIGFKFNQFQILDCVKDGTLYGLVNDNIYIWKFV